MVPAAQREGGQHEEGGGRGRARREKTRERRGLRRSGEKRDKEGKNEDRVTRSKSSGNHFPMTHPHEATMGVTGEWVSYRREWRWSRRDSLLRNSCSQTVIISWWCSWWYRNQLDTAARMLGRDTHIVGLMPTRTHTLAQDGTRKKGAHIHRHGQSHGVDNRKERPIFSGAETGPRGNITTQSNSMTQQQWQQEWETVFTQRQQ